MKKFTAGLILFCAAVALAAPVKTSKVCSKAKKAEACLEELSALAAAGKLGDTNAVSQFQKLSAAAQNNRAFSKPVIESVDSLVWEPCKKREREACLLACEERSDSSFARVDAPDSIACAQKPQKLVRKKVKAPRKNPVMLSLDSIAVDAFWTAPFGVSPRWFEILTEMNGRIALPDSVLPDLGAALAEALRSTPSEIPFQKRFFTFCSVFGAALDSALDSAGVPFRCPEFGVVTDARDGKAYRTERFGDAVWTIDNANFDIPDSSACFDGDSLNCEKFGRLYTFAAAMDACPEGFRPATDDDFSALSPESQAAFAVTVQFGGYFNQSGICTLLGEGTYFWTSTEEDSSRGFVRNLFSDAAALERASVAKNFGLSVRCVQK